MKTKTLKLLTCLLLIAAMVLTQCVFVFAEDNIEGAAAAGIKVIDAIWDFSTYGAKDTFEKAETLYLGSGGFSDVTDAETLKMLGLLSELGIVKGDEEGKFNGDANITRAEFVAMILRMMNVDLDTIGGTNKKFYDVDETHPLSKEIYAACNLGLVTGFNDDTFRPEDSISYEDAVTILTRVMGYTIPAIDSGGYPEGYLFQANRAGITDGVSGTIGLPITRTTMATMIYNCLTDCKVMKPVGYGEEESFAEAGTGLHEFFDVDYTTGILEATEISGIDGKEKSETGKIRIDGKPFKCALMSANNLLGYEVRYYYKYKEDVPTVIYLEKTDNNKEITIKADDIESYSGYTYTYHDGKTEKTANIATDHCLMFNGVQRTVYDESVFTPDTGYVKLLKRNNSTAYDTVFVYTFFNIYSKSIAMDGSVVTITPDYEAQLLEFDMSEMVCELYDANGKIEMGEQAVKTTYDADGNAIKSYSLPPIPTSNLLSIFTDDIRYENGHYFMGPDATYLRIYINTTSFDGTISSIKTDVYDQATDIGFTPNEAETEVKVEVSKDNYFYTGKNKLAVNDYGQLWLDFDGRAALLVTLAKEGDFQYGYIVNTHIEGNFMKKMQIKLMDVKGKVNVYDVKDKIKLNGAAEKDMEKVQNSLKTSAQFLNDASARTTHTVTQPVKFKLNSDGQIIELQTLTASTGVAPGYDEKNHIRREEEAQEYYKEHYYGNTLYKPETSAISEVLGDPTKAYAKDVKVLKFGPPKIYFRVPADDTKAVKDEDFGLFSSWVDQEKHLAEVYDCGDDLAPAFVIVYAEDKIGYLDDMSVVVVDYVATTLDDNGLDSQVLHACNGGGFVDYPAHEAGVFDGLKKGDVIRLKGYNSKDITDYTKLTTISDILTHDYTELFEETGTPIMYDAGDGLYASTLEVYEWSNGDRDMISQAGLDIGDNKRQYQRICHWPSTGTVIRQGACCVTVYRNPDGTYDIDKMSMKGASTSDYQPAKIYGHDNSSKVYYLEGHTSASSGAPGPRYILIVNTKDK